MSLNRHAFELVRGHVDAPARIGAARHVRGGITVLDCGIDEPGGTEAGLLMARAALGGLADVAVVQPAQAACLAAQYGGWRLSGDGYFAMASGPIRAAIGREEIFDTIGHREQPDVAVGILETAKLPPDNICATLAADAHLPPAAIVLLAARTASPAGTLQVVARSLETALHKLHEQHFDLARIVGGRGIAPLPPVPRDDLVAIGRTNDAILYGGFVELEVTGDDASLTAVGPRSVSGSSPAYGDPFLAIFERAGRDFYAIDPALFAPACVEFVNVDTGRRHRFGAIAPEIVDRSFAPAA